MYAQYTSPYTISTSNKTQTKTVQIDLYYMILNKNGNLLICHYMKYERMVISIIAKLPEKLSYFLTKYILTVKRNKNTFKMLRYDSCSTSTFIAAISEYNGNFSSLAHTHTHIFPSTLSIQNCLIKLNCLQIFQCVLCITS